MAAGPVDATASDNAAIGLDNTAIGPDNTAIAADNTAPSPAVPAAVPPAEGTREEPIPPDEELAARGAVIGEIAIRNENIFNTADPEENNWLFRLVNALHAKTRPSLIRSQLLFSPGDPYNRRVLDESERLLRTNPYFYDASIRPVAFRDGRVDIQVVTHDVWTLRPGISFGRSGGANTTSIDVSETNFLGTGAGVGIARSQTPDRTTSSVNLTSRHFAGTWFQGDLLYSVNSDGHKRSAFLERPFFGLDTRWAVSTTLVDDLRVDTIFGRIGVADQFQTHEKTVKVWGGWSKGLVEGRAVRFTIGFTHDGSRFAPAPENTPSGSIPPDRILAYPWIAVERVEDDYEKAKNRNQIMRTEDFYLGSRIYASLGYSNGIFGADRAAVVFGGQLGTSFEPFGSSMLLTSGNVGGRVEGGSVHDTTLQASGSLYIPVSERWLLFSLITGNLGVKLDLDHQITLGGDNGLRGYPRKYQAGDHSALFTLEGRYYTDYYPFRLARVGGAVFFDMGRAWGESFAKAADPGVLRNVGVGLRLGMTRSGLGNVIHLDVAFPLDGDPTISRMQFLVTTKSSF